MDRRGTPIESTLEWRHASTPSVLFRFSKFEGIYFLKRSSKALRASVGRDPFVAVVLGAAYVTGEVSFSTVMRSSKNVQSFFASFFATRSGIGCVHSNCAAVSK
jgi:hypothetical protein